MSKTQESVKTHHVAVLWRPELQPPQHFEMGKPRRSPPCYPLTLALPPEPTGPKIPGMPQHLESRGIILKPGTNIGILAADWQQVETQPLTQFRLQNGSLTIYHPAHEQGTQAGYKDFDEATALMLVQDTQHEDWIDNWLTGELRQSVLDAAKKQQDALIAYKESLRHGG